MRKTLPALATAAAIAIAAVATPSTAQARWGWWGPAALGGFFAGALIASAIASPYLRVPVLRLRLSRVLWLRLRLSGLLWLCLQLPAVLWLLPAAGLLRAAALPPSLRTLLMVAGAPATRASPLLAVLSGESWTRPVGSTVR